MTQLGQYDKRIAFLAHSGGRDPEGQPVTGPAAWTEVGKAWANIRYETGSEAIRSDAITNVLRASIRIQRGFSVTDKMRVQHGVVLFEITAVLPDDDQRHVDLVCEVLR